MKKPKIDFPNLFATEVEIHAGTRGLFVFEQHWMIPVAFLLYSSCGADDRNKAAVTILDSFVKPNYRRCGLRMYMNHLLFERCNASVVSTPTGTKLGGEPFMRAAGYVHAVDGLWYCTRPAFRAALRKWKKRHPEAKF